MGHHGDVRTITLPNPTRLITLALCLGLLTVGCGRKGDPIPRPRAEPLACKAEWSSLRSLKVTLPSLDAKGHELLGIQSIRVYHLPTGAGRPLPMEVVQRGEVMLERSRPDVPGPGQQVYLDLTQRERPAGWIVVVAVRVGGVLGHPSETLPWLHPAVK